MLWPPSLQLKGVSGRVNCPGMVTVSKILSMGDPAIFIFAFPLNTGTVHGEGSETRWAWVG